MKNIISTLLVFTSLLFLQPYYAYCQDTTRTRYESNEDADDQGNIQESHDTAVVRVVRKTVLGLELGFNSSYLITDVNTSRQNMGNPVYGARAGMLLDIPLVSGLYLQPGFFYAMNGGELAGPGTWDVNTLEVPINFIYKFNLSHANFVFVGLGPYVGYNLSGTSPGRNLNIGSDAGTDDLKPWDVGAGVNAGFELSSGLFFRARYQQGFYNLQPVSSYPAINTSSYGIQLGYFFGRNNKAVEAVAYPQHPEQRIWDQ